MGRRSFSVSPWKKRFHFADKNNNHLITFAFPLGKYACALRQLLRHFAIRSSRVRNLNSKVPFQYDSRCFFSFHWLSFHYFRMASWANKVFPWKTSNALQDETLINWTVSARKSRSYYSAFHLHRVGWMLIKQTCFAPCFITEVLFTRRGNIGKFFLLQKAEMMKRFPVLESLE